MEASAIASVNQALNAKSGSSADIALITVKRKSQPPTELNKPVSGDNVTISNRPVNTMVQNAKQESANLSDRQSASSHVIEEYNSKGKLLLTFVDHQNNFIYQIPTVLAAKLPAYNNKLKL